MPLVVMHVVPSAHDEKRIEIVPSNPSPEIEVTVPHCEEPTSIHGIDNQLPLWQLLQKIIGRCADRRVIPIAHRAISDEQDRAMHAPNSSRDVVGKTLKAAPREMVTVMLQQCITLPRHVDELNTVMTEGKVKLFEESALPDVHVRAKSVYHANVHVRIAL